MFFKKAKELAYLKGALSDLKSQQVDTQAQAQTKQVPPEIPVEQSSIDNSAVIDSIRHSLNTAHDDIELVKNQAELSDLVDISDVASDRIMEITESGVNFTLGQRWKIIMSGQKNIALQELSNRVVGMQQIGGDNTVANPRRIRFNSIVLANALEPVEKEILLTAKMIDNLIKMGGEKSFAILAHCAFLGTEYNANQLENLLRKKNEDALAVVAISYQNGTTITVGAVDLMIQSGLEPVQQILTKFKIRLLDRQLEDLLLENTKMSLSVYKQYCDNIVMTPELAYQLYVAAYKSSLKDSEITFPLAQQINDQIEFNNIPTSIRHALTNELIEGINYQKVNN